MPARKYDWATVDPLVIALYSRPRVVGELPALAAQTGIPAQSLNQRATDLAMRGLFTLVDTPTDRGPMRRRVTLHCATCGKAFEVTAGRPKIVNTRWCSKPCRAVAQNKKTAGTCVHCGTPIQIDADKSADHFCGRRCAGAHRRTVSRVTAPCAHCGQMLTPDHVNPSGVYYCNRQCQYASRRTKTRRACCHCGAATLNAKYCSMACWSAAESITTQCGTCGLEMRRWQSKRAAGKGKFCSRACYQHSIAHTGPFPIKPSGLERKVHKALEARGMAYQTGVQLYPYWPDLLFPEAQLVVEIDGDYWHNRPGARERDQVRQTAIEAMGYRVLRLAEHAIKADMGACIELIAAELRRLAGEG